MSRTDTDLVSTQLAVLLSSVDIDGGLSESTVDQILSLYDHQVLAPTPCARILAWQRPAR